MGTPRDQAVLALAGGGANRQAKVTVLLGDKGGCG
jgi:hypothetical protein